MRAGTRVSALLVVASLLAAAAQARADDLPARKQALLLLRVLVYDRNLRARAGDAVRVAVAFLPGDRESEEQRDALVAAFEGVSREVVVAGLPVKVVAVPFNGPADLGARLAAARPTTLYACARLEGAAGAIARATRRLHVLSAAGSRQMAEAGLAIGLVNRGARASVVVNLQAAREEGADLDAALLAIAEVLP